jgi:hypothetical protein
MHSGSARQEPAALYLRPHDIWQLKPPAEEFVNMHVESERQAVGVSVLHAALHVDPKSVHSELAWHCVCDWIEAQFGAHEPV